MKIAVTLFAGFQARSPDGPLKLGYDRGRLLLAILVLARGQPVSREYVAEQLWPEEAEGVARRRLREVVYRLRKALRDGDRLTPLIASNKRELWSPLSPELTCDVLVFDALVQSAKTHVHLKLHSCHVCIEALKQAHGMVSGELLLGTPCTPDDWLDDARRSRSRDLVWVLEQLGQGALVAGNATSALGLSGTLLGLNPLHESGLRLKMEALHALHRRSELVEAYNTFAEALQAAGRPPPDDKTEELYQAALHNELSARPSGLIHAPTPVTALIGRADELSWLLEALAHPQKRLMSLVGLGGIGKTRLALEAIRQSASLFPDGVRFVSAVDCESPDQLLRAIRAHLGLHSSTEDALQELLAWLQGRRVLWVLDNVEQINEVSQVINGLLRGAGGLKILATSRRRLGLRAESLLTLQGLQGADARTLWLERAHQLSGSFVPDNSALDELCELLGGHPLALEFSAALSDTTPTSAILDRLKSGLSLYSSYVDVPARQASLQLVLGDAIDGLDPHSAGQLQGLSVFHGAFTAESAQAICGLTQTSLCALLDRSLVGQRANGQLRLHPVVRQYLLQQTPPSIELREKHRRWFLSKEQLPVGNGVEWLRDDLRAAWLDAVASEDLGLIAERVKDLQWGLLRLGWHPEAAAWLEQACIVLERHPGTAAQRRTLANTGLAVYRMGRSTAAEAYLTRAVTLSVEANQPEDQVRAISWLAFVLRNSGKPTLALVYLAQAISLCEREQMSSHIPLLRYSYGTSLYESGQLDNARRELEHAAGQLRSSGNIETSATAMGVLGLCEVLVGETKRGLDRFPPSAKTLRVSASSAYLDLLNAWACAALIAGKTEEATHRSRRAYEGYTERGFAPGQASTSGWLAMASFARGAVDSDERLVRHLEHSAALETDRALIESACVLAWALRRSKPARAARFAASVLVHPEHIAELRALAAQVPDARNGQPLSRSELRAAVLGREGRQE